MKNALRLLLVVALVLTMLTASTASATPPKCENTTGIIEPTCGDGDDDDDDGGSGGCSPTGCADKDAINALSGVAFSVA